MAKRQKIDNYGISEITFWEPILYDHESELNADALDISTVSFPQKKHIVYEVNSVESDVNPFEPPIYGVDDSICSFEPPVYGIDDHSSLARHQEDLEEVLDDGGSDDSRGARAGGSGSHDTIELSVISTIQTEK